MGRLVWTGHPPGSQLRDVRLEGLRRAVLGAHGFAYTQQAGGEQGEGGWLRGGDRRDGCAERRRVAVGLEVEAAAGGAKVLCRREPAETPVSVMEESRVYPAN